MNLTSIFFQFTKLCVCVCASEALGMFKQFSRFSFVLFSHSAVLYYIEVNLKFKIKKKFMP